MARPNKEGLDYFPLDVNCDDKVKLIEAKFGIVGFGVLIKLWQIIYESGYSLTWTERELLLYKNRINVDINLINDIINECVKWNIFDEGLFKKHILSSTGIQKRYLGAINRRHEITIDKDIWLLEIPNSTDKLKVNVYINEKNADINSQSKVNRKEIEIDSNNEGYTNPMSEESSNEPKKKDLTPYDEIVLFYNSNRNKMSEARTLSKTRKGLIHARYLTYGIDPIKEVILKSKLSDFMNGGGNKAWVADLGWIMRPENFTKIFEGKYDNRNQVGFQQELKEAPKYQTTNYGREEE